MTRIASTLVLLAALPFLVAWNALRAAAATLLGVLLAILGLWGGR
jgi:uncharacterized membrane protein